MVWMIYSGKHKTFILTQKVFFNFFIKIIDRDPFFGLVLSANSCYLSIKSPIASNE